MKGKFIKLMTLSMLVLSMSVVFTGCFNSDDSTASTTETTSEEDVSQGSENAVDDVVEGVEDGAEDIANGFDDYDDAHDYLLNQISSANNNDGSSYEVRNEDKDVTEYQSGSKGYHYEIYDTSKGNGEKLGDFYVDQDNGKIYRKNKDTNKVEEYNGEKE